ncbi:penicillin-binding protein 2 [bacterium]|nr:penicillin-binding protein 2 [bacterium]
MSGFISRRDKVRIIVYFSILLSFFALTIMRLVFLQIIEHDHYMTMAEKQRMRKIKLNPKRGTIFDTNNRELALSIDVDSLFAHPHQIEDVKETARILGPILHMSQKQIIGELSSDRPFVWLARHISPQERSQIESADLTGLGFLKESKRYYPKRFLSGHVLGFAGVDNQGLEGLELKYDQILKGSEGWYICNLDARKRTILVNLIKSPTSGANLVLTIDEVVQYFAEKELSRACLEEKARGGMVVIMDPKTGAILAMANYPSFNPNNFESSSSRDWRNRCIVDSFEPGSTIKTLVLASALEERLISPHTVFDCRGGKISYAQHSFHDWKPFGKLTAQEVLAHSSNVGAISIGERLGQERLYEYYRKFGLGSTTKADFPGEAVGLLRSPASWSSLTLPSLSIGYEVSVSALQMVNAYACLANNGILMVPRLVKEIRNDRAEVLKYFSPQIATQVVSSGTAAVVKELLRNTVQWGTGEKADLAGYDVCGKTGTVRKFDKTQGRYSSQKIIASFIGFAPYSKPEIVIGVFLDEPKKSEWGSSSAAPVFRRIAEQVLRYLQVKQSYTYAYDLDRLEPGTIAGLLDPGSRSAHVVSTSSVSDKNSFF